LYSATGQCVADDLNPNASFTGLLAQSGHFTYGYATGIRNYRRQRTLSSFMDFSDNRFFTIKS
jgi:hypothetical protein